jgi:hypothetical protein
MRIGIACLALIVAFGALFAPATAQEITTGTIAGKITDPAGKPIPGAVIIATSQFGTRTAEADANGNYVVPFLRPGTYNVRVEAPGGFTTVIQNDVIVSLNQRTNLNFTLEPGKTETVTVTAASPLVDIKSTASGTNVKYDEFANAVPLGRSFTDTYAVAPGVVSGLGTGEGNYSISGSTGLENAYLIDGVNITNAGFGGIGSYNIIFGSLGTGVTSEFLDEVQIKTGGFEAEYGQALGGIINTIVKSGTNDFKGSVAWYSSPRGLQSGRFVADLEAGTASRVGEDVNDFAFQIGGPIIKDKLFYFVAYNPVLSKHRIRANSILNPAFTAASAGVAAFDEGLATGFDAPGPLAFPSSVGELERERQANNYAAKLSWVINPKHQLELTFFGDPADGDEGPQRLSAALRSDFATGGGLSEIEYGSHNQALKWSAVFGPRFFMEAQVARHDGKFRERSTLDQYSYSDVRNVLEFNRGADSYDDPVLGITPLELSPVAPLRGGVGFVTNQDDENTQYSVKLTNVIGKHEIKYGVQYDDIEYAETPGYSGPSFTISLPTSDPTTGFPDGGQIDLPSRGGALVTVRNGTGGTPDVAYDGANIFRVTRARLGPELEPTQAEELNFFVQDTWSIHPRFTIKAGVRWTQETLKGAGSFTLPFGTQVFTDPVTMVSHRIFTPGTSTYTPDEYTFAGNWAPRFGVIWDVLGNGKSRAWANWSRYYERVPGDLAVRAFSNEVGISRQQFTDRDLTTWDTGAVFTQGIDETNVVPGAKLPYVDELSGGYAFEVSPNSAIEVRAIYRTQGRVLEDVQVNSAEAILNFYYGTGYGYYPYDPFPGFTPAVFGSYELGNPGTNQVPAGGDFPTPVRRYKALELIYTKRFSDNWSLFANYRFARLVGNYEGLFRNDNGQSDPNITSLYDFPNSPLMSGQFAPGPLPTDVSHVLHVYPSYTFANKIRVGANFSWSSGVPRTSFLAHPIYQNDGEIPGIKPVYAYWADPGSGNELRTTSNLGDALADPDRQPFGGPFLFSYTPVKRGNLGRTSDLVTLDLHADYPLQTGKTRINFMLDIFNVFQTQEVLTFVDTIELQAGVPDPDFLKPLTYQAPRSWRLAARWDF